MYSLVVRTGKDQGRIFEITSAGSTIGRHPVNSIVLNDILTSSNHAEIYMDQKTGKMVLTDCNSRNGTFVNNSRINGNVVLNNGDIIRIGLTVFEYKMDEEQSAVIEDLSQSILLSRAAINTDELFDNEVEVKNNKNRLKRLYRISRELHSELELNKVIQHLIETLFDIWDFDYGSIFLYNKNNDLVPYIYTHRDKTQEGVFIPVSRTISEHVTSTKNSVISRNVQKDSRFDVGQSMIAHNIQSIMCAPLIVKDNVIGLIQMITKKEMILSEEDLNFFSAIALQAASAIENARLVNQIQEEARIRNNLRRYMPETVVESIINNEINIELGGERKYATIMFLDIRGFTSMSEKMTPNEVITLLNEYFSEMCDIVFANNGTLDKFIGDCMMVVFGAPFTHPHDAYNAVKTAVQIQDRIVELNKQRSRIGKPTIQVGIGINTGEVVAGNLGSRQRMEYTSIGNVVNLASRLTSIAGPSEIVISRETYENVSENAEVEAMKPVTVKGIQGQVEVYKVKKIM